MKSLHVIAFILVIVGGLNWLLIGIGGWNVVDVLGMTLARIVYVLVGLSAVYLVVSHKKTCSCCQASGSQQM